MVTNKELPSIKTQKEYVEDVERQVQKLIQDGTVPPTIKSYSDLHDYVDANVDCLSTIDQDFGCFDANGNFTADSETPEWQKRWDEALVMANAVIDEVDKWIVAGKHWEGYRW